mmetsp:Transcript_118566/g.330799  ORF Transcript_118566/g.330799 Transcript_118566/m.330799 type:complete len:300 (+) Transcript_118566:74-973(+)
MHLDRFAGRGGGLDSTAQRAPCQEGPGPAARVVARARKAPHRQPLRQRAPLAAACARLRERGRSRVGVPGHGQLQRRGARLVEQVGEDRWGIEGAGAPCFPAGRASPPPAAGDRHLLRLLGRTDGRGVPRGRHHHAGGRSSARGRGQGRPQLRWFGAQGARAHRPLQQSAATPCIGERVRWGGWSLVRGSLHGPLGLPVPRRPRLARRVPGAAGAGGRPRGGQPAQDRGAPFPLAGGRSRRALREPPRARERVRIGPAGAGLDVRQRVAAHRGRSGPRRGGALPPVRAARRAAVPALAV